ncbi:MAG: hypothetical protein OSJ74_01100, partial [Clostridia bacterium]|nr:hypothetical protein [Clostridia bacterium]
VYTYNKDGQYYWLTGKALSEEELAELEVFSFKSSLLDSPTYTEKINYISKNDDTYCMTGGIPTCYGVIGEQNGCTSVAGANIIQFMDKKSPNLIPDYEPGKTISGLYIFNSPSAITDELTRQLYKDMETNSDGGASVAQFKSGMTKYCERMGYKLHFDKSIANGGKFNYEYTKVQLMSHRPLALFVNNYSYNSIYSTSNTDSIETKISDGRHAMAAFGYREITYTLSSGTRVDSYLYVSTGIYLYETGYFNINKNTTIEECYGLFVTDIT